MRLRFWIGLAAVAADRAGSVGGGADRPPRRQRRLRRTQRDEAVRAAHQAEAVAALSVGQLTSAAAFFQAEDNFSRHEFDVDRPLAARPGGAERRPPSSPRVPGSERARFERSHGVPILERGPRAQLPRRARQRRLLPDRLRRRQRARQRRRRSAMTSAHDARPRALPAPRPRQRQAGRRRAVIPLLIGGDRHQRLPGRLPRRRADRDRRRSGAGPWSASPPAPSASPTSPAATSDRPDRRRSAAARSTATPSSAPRGRLDDGAAPRCGSPTAPGCWSSATPSRPGISLPLLLAVRRPRPGRAARRADPRLEPQRTDAGAGAAGEPGPADRPQEPAPLRRGPAGGDGAEPPRRHHRGAADARPRPLQAGQRHPRPPGRRPADRRRSPTCCAGAPARATSWPGSAATSSRSILPRCSQSEARAGGRGDRDGDPRAPRRRTAGRAAHRQHRRRAVRRPTRAPASPRSSPRPTRRCTRPRTGAATRPRLRPARGRASDASWDERRPTERERRAAAQVEHPLGGGLELARGRGGRRAARRPAPATPAGRRRGR